MNTPTVTLTRKGLFWYKTGHAWIYRSDLKETRTASSGDIVDILDERGKYLAKGFYGDKSKIGLRVLTREREEIERSFFERRIKTALDRRKGYRQDGGACRLIYSEGDELPGLIVDQYADWIVMQAMIPAVEIRAGMIADILKTLCSPKGILCRNDAIARALEGLSLDKKIISGERPGLLEIREGAISYLADIWNGHKTGAYLDQRENRVIVSKFASGRVLDCFSYQGHFALHCATCATDVTAVESSPEARSMIEKNIKLNGFSNIKPVEGNVFDLLRIYHKEKKKFDTIVLDPPPLARKKANAEDALRGYKEINLRAMYLLPPGGVLATFCCSHSISHDIFFEILRAAAADSRCSLQVVRELAHPSDHPILINVPETAYLKGFILRKI